MFAVQTLHGGWRGSDVLASDESVALHQWPELAGKCAKIRGEITRAGEKRVREMSLNFTIQ